MTSPGETNKCLFTPDRALVTEQRRDPTPSTGNLRLYWCCLQDSKEDVSFKSSITLTALESCILECQYSSEAAGWWAHLPCLATATTYITLGQDLVNLETSWDPGILLEVLCSLQEGMLQVGGLNWARVHNLCTLPFLDENHQSLLCTCTIYYWVYTVQLFSSRINPLWLFEAFTSKGSSCVYS